MSLLPLYRGHAAPATYTDGSNTGLWYNKFVNKWGAEWQFEEGKKEWVKTMDSKVVGEADLIRETVERMAHLTSALGGETRCFATAWHFVTGLGLEHPVENGFAWHYTLGVPFIPASSVKGVVRSWAETEGAEDEEVARVLGSQATVGSVIFFDALPVKPVKLQADVMTPHYSHYHQDKGGPACPGDWDDPVPIPFLTVASNQVFMFSMAPRRKDNPEDCADLERSIRWLEEALEFGGIGAKTATGYGRFVRRETVETELISTYTGQNQISAKVPEGPMSPIRKEMEADGYSDKSTARFMEALTKKWLSRMESSDHSAEERHEIATLLKAWYIEYLPAMWKKPNKKNASKIARIKKVLEP